MSELTEYDEIRLREAFQLLDFDNSGEIDSSELRTGCQLFGLNPSVEEVAEVKVALGKDRVALSYEDFTEFVLRLNKSNDTVKHELDVATRVIMEETGASDSDTVDKEQLKAILKARGDDPMTEEEIDELFQDIGERGDDDAAIVTRQEFVDLLTKDL